MKTGLGIHRKFRLIIAYINIIRFEIRKRIIGFDVANLFLQRVDKRSIPFILKQNGANIGKNCDFETGVVFHNCKSYSNLTIGNNCHIGKQCFFDLSNKIIIGNNVVISMQNTFITHIDLGKSSLSEQYPATTEAIHIGDNCYLGARCTLLKGVNLSEDVFVAAGSLLIKTIPNAKKIGGVPARNLKG